MLSTLNRSSWLYGPYTRTWAQKEVRPIKEAPPSEKSCNKEGRGGSNDTTTQRGRGMRCRIRREECVPNLIPNGEASLEVRNMMPKKPKPPITQRTFANIWGELDYVCKKIRYWLYTRKQRARAVRYLDRLERVLRDLPESDMAIIRQEGLALLHELKGEIGESIAHRGQEIALMERLYTEAQSPKYADSTRDYMLRDRDMAALQERRAILEALKKVSDRQSDLIIRRAQ
jgi:hypothetical protein